MHFFELFQGPESESDLAVSSHFIVDSIIGFIDEIHDGSLMIFDQLIGFLLFLFAQVKAVNYLSIATEKKNSLDYFLQIFHSGNEKIVASLGLLCA